MIVMARFRWMTVVKYFVSCVKKILMYRQLERLKHDLLRLESKRVQCELEGNQTQVEVVETKILKKKNNF